MRGLVLRGVGRVEVEEVAEPNPTTPDSAVVDVSLAGLCGSDLHAYLGREPARTGVVQGHEAVGVVSEVGDDVTRVAVGDRVIVPFTTSCGHCRRCASGLSSRCEVGQLFGWGDPASDAPALHGAQAERLAVPFADGTLVEAPAMVDDAAALLLADNLPTAWYAVTRADWSDGPIAVIGLGAVGQCAVAVALSSGRGPVLAIDPVADRRDAAERQSARVESLTPEEAIASGRRVRAVVEAAGPPAAQRLAAALAEPGATISIIAVQTSDAFAVGPVAAYDRNLTIRTGRAPVRSLLEPMLDRISAGTLTVPTSVITHPERTLDDAPDMYRLFAERKVTKATFRM